MALQMGILFLALLGLSTALICPDGGMCEDKNTCCKNTVGGYGCCPLPHAECCSDHLHCCYQGTLCDLVHKTCVNKTVSLPWMRRLPAKQALLVPRLSERVKAVICPDQESECPDGTTCCQLPDGSWGCCPLAKAVCCEDKRHCCPEGTKCDIAHSKCVSPSLQSFPMLEKLPARMRDNNPALTVGSLTCPDKKTSCPNNYTCCQLTPGDYGCCPFPDAICCKDHIRCCPRNTTCDLKHDLCISGETSVPMQKKIPAIPKNTLTVGSLTCPDKKTSCPNNYTCCQLTPGDYGCCPFPDAICCKDHIRCCPRNTTCDLKHDLCISGETSVPMQKKIPAIPKNTLTVGSLTCPDKKTSCPNNYTCCQLTPGDYGCCPFPDAICCKDHIRCCPRNTTCDLKHDLCISGETSVPMQKKIPAISKNTLTVGSLMCPDKKTNCPNNYTCCQLTPGDYGCCPFPDAICCKDHIRCCPRNTTCDLKHDLCISGETSVPMQKKIPAIPKNTLTVGSVTCPDGKTSCPDNSTCCQLKSGDYGCCPFPEAVCCEDHLSCCPRNTVCDLKHDMCISGETYVPMQKKIPAIPKNTLTVGSVTCPDGKTSCPDNSTCCQLKSGDYGCCPFPEAVCCEDHLSCCPRNTVCDLKHDMCISGETYVPMQKKIPAIPKNTLNVGSVTCPDGKTSCPDNSTCCQLKSGDYGCCPFPEAVCCEDHLSCCPRNTVCDLKHGMCISGETYVPMQKKIPAIPKNTLTVGSVTCPDGKTSCPDNSTCCQLKSGDYGCCPFPEAVCCKDHLHCCPKNTTCDLEHDMCSSGETHVPMQRKIPAIPNDIDCPDKQSSCPDQTTCCQMTNGSYGCCPMPNAVCCSDHLHCCPEGTECDLFHSTCLSAGGPAKVVASTVPATVVASTVPAAVMELAAAQNKAGAVPCNESVACADGNTCCKSSAGEWACCPLPKAVCCEDHLHCCPHGTVCNLAASTCDDPEGNALTPWLANVPASPLLAANSKCDRSTSCPGKATCCKTASGDWACCPLPQAVCCDDHVHCCPHGTVCNLKAETCDDPSGFSPSLPWAEKVSALSSEVRDEKCDKETMCPGGTTCCKKNSGQWACCPLPQAVCCSDHEHCCPKGYKCNVAEQTCDKPGAPSLPWLRKIPALRVEPGQALSGPARPAKNMCDARTSCPKDTTCCFMDRTHKWGCCPLPKAVCCKDGNHCCPSGHTCEPHRSSCSKGPHVIPWFTKLSAQTEPGAVTDVKCDDKSSCASGTTCCKLPTGEWGCCPLVKAVCCADHEHCCPQGYTCNMQTGTCEKKYLGIFVQVVPQSKVSASEPRGRAEDEADVACDDKGEFHCPKQETCCRMSAAEWACCPSPRATCCSDSRHCCPVGYACDLKAGGCILKTQLTWDTLFGDRQRHFVPRGL